VEAGWRERQILRGRVFERDIVTIGAQAAIMMVNIFILATQAVR
jgi:hypothetical protein